MAYCVYPIRNNARYNSIYQPEALGPDELASGGASPDESRKSGGLRR